MTICSVVTAKGFGLNMWDVEPDNLTTAFAIFFFGQMAYLSILGLCKISVLLFYIRIFPYERCRLLCHLTLGFVVITTILYQLLVLCRCYTITYNWEGWKTGRPQKKCLDFNLLGSTSAGTNIAQDLIVLLTPVPWIWGLNCSRWKKVQIWGMFGVGIL